MRDATGSRDEAEMLHRALESAFASILPVFDADAVFERRRGHVYVACPRLPLPVMNGVWVNRTDDVAAEELREARRTVEAAGAPFGMLMRDVGPSELTLASRLGLGLAEELPGMVMSPPELTGQPTTVEIARVEDTRQLEDALRVAAAGFGVPVDVFAPMYSTTVLATPGVTVYLAAVDGEPVSTAISFLRGGSVGIFNVATPPAFRQRGYGAAVTRRACVDGFDRGARTAFLQATGEGHGVYRTLGFRTVVTYSLFGART